MMHIVCVPEKKSCTLHVIERRRDKWRRASVKIERFYSRKRMAAIFRRMAELIEMGFPGD